MTSALASGVGVRGEKEEEPAATVDVMRGEGRWKETSSEAAKEEGGTLADGKAGAGVSGPAVEPSRVVDVSTRVLLLLPAVAVTEDDLTILGECVLGVTRSPVGGVDAESTNLATPRDVEIVTSVVEQEPAALEVASTDEFRRFHTVELLNTTWPTPADRVGEEPMPPAAGMDASEPLVC